MGALLLAAIGGVISGCTESGDHPEQTSAEAAARESARHFLSRYVDGTGRVVRHDQGGDTVSEGQAYALLLAVALGDREKFDRVWNWTRDNLQRPDRLFSWHWDAGVTDEQSASDADLDIARSLVVAGRTFDEPELERHGVEVGRQVLERSTAVVAGHRILLPGPWAKEGPMRFNASYVSPAATQQLYEASDDRRWVQVERGSRRLVQQLVEDGLPPDWAEVDRDGSLRPAETSSGWDALRVPIRHAESCVPADRELAAELAGSLDDVDSQSSLSWMARAAARLAAGASQAADTAMAEATEVRRTHPTYYGDAWEALGRFMLLDDRLGGCPEG